MPDNSGYANELALLMIYDARMRRAGERLGLSIFPIDYWYMHDSQITQILPFNGVPGDYPYWNKGKEAEKNRQNGYGGHIYEMVLNTNPSVCYLSSTNTVPMQLHVMAHAVWGHVDFFKNNMLFAHTQPQTVLARFKQASNKITALVENPEWGWELVEHYMDAIHSLDNYVGWLPQIEGRLSDKVLREQLKQELVDVRRAIKTEGELSASLKRQLTNQADALDAHLRRYPIEPTDDLLGFLIDPDNTPNLPEEVRMLLSIVRDRSLYFQPQARTKFMNEGWASYWQREILLQPEVDLPFAYRFDLAQSWTMHDQMPMMWYTDPYALGQLVWRHIDTKYGKDEGTTKVQVHQLLTDDTGKPYESKRATTVEVTVRNRDKMLEVRRHYDDSRFMDEYVNEELFEFINGQALEWVYRVMHMISDTLLRNGWSSDLVHAKLPPDLEGLAQILGQWMEVQESSAEYHNTMGTPIFPVPPQTLQQIGAVLQTVFSFDTDKHKARRQVVLRTASHWVPNIRLVDTGKFGDNSWTLMHTYDENFGPLLQSECRETLKFFWRLRGTTSPVRLMTMELKTDPRGQPIGSPIPYEYFTEDGDNVKERWLR